MVRRYFVIFMISVLVLGWTTAFADQNESTRDNHVGGMYGGELRIAVKKDLTLNPLSASPFDESSWNAISIVYDSLARIDPFSLLPVPWVALNWSISDDNVTVYLRNDVKWHRGGNLTAQDVDYTFSNSNGLKSTTKFGFLLSGLQTSVIDNHTIAFDLSNYGRKGIFLSKVLTMPLIPDGYTRSDEENGCGPFMLEKSGTYDYVIMNETVVENATEGRTWGSIHSYYLRDDVYDFLNSLTIYKNGNRMTEGSDYLFYPLNGTVNLTTGLHQGDAMTASLNITTRYTRLVSFGEYFYPIYPYISAVNYTFYPDDDNTTFDEATDGASKAMIDDRIDFIGWKLSSDDLTAERFEMEKGKIMLQDYSKEIDSPGLDFLYVGLNTIRPPLNDSALRKAIAMCMDKEVHLSYEPRAIIADSVITPENAYWFNKSIPQYRIKKKVENGEQKSDLDAVRVFLDVNGYLDPDNDGWREMPDGSDFNFTLLHPSTWADPRKAPIAIEIRTKLQSVGINVITVGKTFQQIDEKVSTTDDFDMFLNVLHADSDPYFTYDFLHSGADRNYANYASPELDGLLEEMNNHISPSERQSFVFDTQGWISEKAPIVPLLHYDVIEVVEPRRFTGWVEMLGGINNFWSFLKIHLIQAAQPQVTLVIPRGSFNAGELVDMKVIVSNETGAPIADGFVSITNSMDPEMILEGYTDQNGTFEGNWTAIEVATSDTAVITAVTKIPGRPDGEASYSITIHPSKRSLYIDVSKNNASIGSGEHSDVSVTVYDGKTFEPVGGADVNISITPEGLEGSVLSSMGQTDANGVFKTTFTGSVSVDTSFKITATVTASGYQKAESSTSVFVTRHGGQIPSADILSMIALVASSTMLYGYLRRKHKAR